MKKLFSAFILCTAILCGCSEKGGEEISETSVPETSSATVTTESSYVTSAKTETAVAKETTVTEPAEEKTVLTPIPSEVYDIGGGYVCFTTGKGEDKILNVAIDNIITDSIKLNNMCFEPNWQINFYDMDTPPCFALEVGRFVSVNDQPYFIGSIDYCTYFVIDGKITEMNWTLDGERLDTVDYTMLKCRGEEDEFVSYSAPGYDCDMLERCRFSFANGSYTDIAGHTEEVPKPEGSAAIADELLDRLSALYFDVLNFELPCNTDEQNIKYYTEEDIMNALCEFCTKTVAEEFFNIVSRELYIVDDRFYSYDEAPAWFPPVEYVEAAEEKDGVITARLFSYYVGQDIPHHILPPVYAEFVREDGVWKISSLPKEK